MINNKKIACLILSSLFVASLFTGCGAKKAPTTSVTPNKPETLVVYSYEALKDTEYSTAVQTFEKDNNCKIKFNVIESAKFVQGFMVAASGGNEIDALVLNGQDTRNLSNKGLLMDLSNDITYKDRFNDNSINQFTFDGKLYGVPWGSVDTSAVYINKDVFTKYNIKIPVTYADMIAANNELKKHNMTLFGFGGGSAYMWPMWYFDLFAQTSGNKSVQRTIDALSGKAKFTDNDFVEAMKVLGNFGKEGMFQVGVNGADSAGGAAIFTGGKSAAFFGGTWELAGFRKAGLDATKLDMIPFPIVKEGAKSEQTGSAGSGALAIYSKIPEAKKQLTLKLIDFLSSEKGVQAARDSQTVKSGFAFSATKTVKPDSTDALADTIQNTLIPSTVTFLDWIWPAEITKEFQQDLQAVVGQKMTAEEAMAKIQKVYDDIVTKGYKFNAVK